MIYDKDHLHYSPPKKWTQNIFFNHLVSCIIFDILTYYANGYHLNNILIFANCYQMF